MSVVACVDAVIVGGSSGAMVGGWVTHLWVACRRRSVRRDSWPRCSHCGHRIRDGLQLTDIDGSVTVHWHGDRAKCRAAAEAVKRPDYARIASLEKELLGIEPEASTVVALNTAFVPRSIRRDRATNYLRPAELREMLTEMGSPVQFPSQQEIDDFIFRKARQQECPHEATVAIGTLAQPWRRLCTDCGLTFDAKPVPPPGPGAGSPVGRAVEQHRRAMARLREVRANLDAQRAEFEARRADFDRLKAQMLSPNTEPPKP